MDLLIDQSTNDIVFINGGCPVTSSTSESIAQKLKIKLSTFLGEWFLDTTVGVPYFERILGRARSKDVVDLLIREQVESESMVEEVISFNSSLANRRYEVSFRVRTVDGGLSEPITITI